jgi:uncharacterized protein (TIGR01777 family)
MQIAITGATGFLGQNLIRAAVRRGHEVVAFSRDPKQVLDGCIEVRNFSLDEAPDLRGCDAIVHLAGESIAGWWSRRKKNRIRDSRIQGTRRVVEGIQALSSPPDVLVCASAVGYYGDCGEGEVTEASPPGRGFLADVCRAWEMEAVAAEREPVTRVVRTRFGMILGHDGGALRPMSRAFRFCIGGPLGSGQQWWSWIHVADAASLLLFAVENLDARGSLNATAPWPVRNTEFTGQLARAVRRPAFLRIPAWALRILLRDFAHVLLESTRALPSAAQDLDFPFRFPELAPALHDLLA